MNMMLEAMIDKAVREAKQAVGIRAKKDSLPQVALHGSFGVAMLVKVGQHELLSV